MLEEHIEGKKILQFNSQDTEHWQTARSENNPDSESEKDREKSAHKNEKSKERQIDTSDYR